MNKGVNYTERLVRWVGNIKFGTKPGGLTQNRMYIFLVNVCILLSFAMNITHQHNIYFLYSQEERIKKRSCRLSRYVRLDVNTAIRLENILRNTIRHKTRQTLLSAYSGWHIKSNGHFFRFWNDSSVKGIEITNLNIKYYAEMLTYLPNLSSFRNLPEDERRNDDIFIVSKLYLYFWYIS